MAKIEKSRLDFFPLDIDFFEDEKIVAISSEFGCKGELAAVKLLCEVYRNGYYMEWKEPVRIKLMKKMPGVSAGLLENIVRRLVRWGFFDQTLFHSASILTSRGIQRRYFSSYSRRFKVTLPYLLVSDAKTKVIAAETKTNEPCLLFDDLQDNEGVIAAKTQVIDVKTAETGVIAAKTKVIAAEKPIKETKQDNSKSSLRSDMSPGATQDDAVTSSLDLDAFVEYFNGKVKGTTIPAIVKLNAFRKGLLYARVREYGKEALATVVEKSIASDFLTGGTGQFIARFDWIFRPRNFPKILEGNYDNKLNLQTNAYGTTVIRSFEQPTMQQRISEELSAAAEHFQQLISPAEAGVHSSLPRKVW